MLGVRYIFEMKKDLDEKLNCQGAVRASSRLGRPGCEQGLRGRALPAGSRAAGPRPGHPAPLWGRGTYRLSWGPAAVPGPETGILQRCRGRAEGQGEVGKPGGA